ncbi:MAG: hypothetical protein OXD49_04535 [Candidatus Poribacteria bacterium]|nr:hypothetical protein [Candidatus Poribacteria bacterium]
MTRILALQKLKVTFTLGADVTTVLSQRSNFPGVTSCACPHNN